jgi:transposase
MGIRGSEQASMWIATGKLPKSLGHLFYTRLNPPLDAGDFDRFVEGQCVQFYAPVMEWPSLEPGRYFRLLLVSYFEGIDSERGIAWRASDSLAVRSVQRLGGLGAAAGSFDDFLHPARNRSGEPPRGLRLGAAMADGVTAQGKTIALDAITLEANAAMRSIVRRDTEESYQEFLTRLAKASGIKTPTREALALLDRQRKKKTSNQDWKHPRDPDAKVAKMKDGRTNLAHKAE